MDGRVGSDDLLLMRRGFALAGEGDAAGAPSTALLFDDLLFDSFALSREPALCSFGLSGGTDVSNRTVALDTFDMLSQTV